MGKDQYDNVKTRKEKRKDPSRKNSTSYHGNKYTTKGTRALLGRLYNSSEETSTDLKK